MAASLGANLPETSQRDQCRLANDLIQSSYGNASGWNFSLSFSLVGHHPVERQMTVKLSR
jgi:hypothetical protein